MDAIWNQIQTAIEDYAPQAVGAAIIIAVGWLVALLVSRLVSRVLHRTDLDEKIARSLESSDVSSTESGIASASFWVIMLLVIVAALETLEFDAVTAPLSDVVASLLGFVPNLLAAGVILAIGYVIARVLRGVSENVSAAFGLDQLGERVGAGPSGAAPKLSQTVGLIVFALVLIPTIVAALNALEIESVAGPTSNMLDTILDAVPSIFAAALLLVIAYLVARIVAQLVSNILAGLGFNTLPTRLGMSPEQGQVAGRSPSQLAGDLLMAALLFLAAIEAAELVGFTALSTLLADFLTYFGQILVGLVIIGIGFWLARVVGTAIESTGVVRARLLSAIGRVCVIVLAVAIGLGEMGIAEEIVILAFGVPLLAVGVGLAIGLGVAIGLGGREVAAQEFERLRRADGSSTGGSQS